MAESSAPDGFPVTLTVAAGAAVDNQIAVMMKDMRRRSTSTSRSNRPIPPPSLTGS